MLNLKSQSILIFLIAVIAGVIVCYYMWDIGCLSSTNPNIIWTQLNQTNGFLVRLNKIINSANDISAYFSKSKLAGRLSDSNAVIPKSTVIAIVTLGRTGSTFTGEILNSHPGVFYLDEPLHVYDGVDRVLRHELVQNAKNLTRTKKQEIKREILKPIFNCQFTGKYMAEYIRYNQNPKVTRNFARSRVLTELLGCNSMPDDNLKITQCPLHSLNATKLRQACKRYKYLVVKLLRADIGDLLPFYNSTDYLFKVIYLVRDPRGIVNSQHGTGWFARPNSNLAQQMSISANNTCRPLLKGILDVAAVHPERNMVLRYEDMAMKPHIFTKKVLDFVGLRIADSVAQHINSHVKSQRRHIPHDWFSYRNNSTATALAWKKTMKSHLQKVVQSIPSCDLFIRKLSYDKLANQTIL